MAISNDRLIGIENDEVLFWYHDKRDGGKKKIARLPEGVSTRERVRGNCLSGQSDSGVSRCSASG
ncbi:MAG: hypothetical protein WCB49_02450 [Gammaproteobacteria bacterium]